MWSVCVCVCVTPRAQPYRNYFVTLLRFSEEDLPVDLFVLHVKKGSYHLHCEHTNCKMMLPFRTRVLSKRESRFLSCFLAVVNIVIRVLRHS